VELDISWFTKLEESCRSNDF